MPEGLPGQRCISVVQEGVSTPGFFSKSDSHFQECGFDPLSFYSEGDLGIEFVPDEEWNPGFFVQGLRFRHKKIHFTSDYVSGRLMKTDIDFELGGKVTIITRNRGMGAEMLLLNLQGRKHIQAVK